MQARPIRHRRGKRGDFEALRHLLGTALGDDRQSHRRFRRLVADLGADFYVATLDDVVCGAIHLSYARHLTAGASATLELLLVAETAPRPAVQRVLLDLASQRARRRGCRQLTWRAAAAEAVAVAHECGWRAAGTALVFDLPADAD